MGAIYKARVINHKLMSDHIQFRLGITKDGEPVEVFSKSYISASTPEKTDIVLGMSRKRLSLLGLDMDTCTDDEWDAFVKIETLLAGREVDVEEKDNPPYGLQYDILTNTVASPEKCVSIRNALRGAKKVAPPAPPAARPISPAPVKPPLPGPKPLASQNII